MSALDHCRELYLSSVEIVLSLIRKRVANYDLNYRSFWPTTAAETIHFGCCMQMSTTAFSSLFSFKESKKTKSGRLHLILS